MARIHTALFPAFLLTVAATSLALLVAPPEAAHSQTAAAPPAEASGSAVSPAPATAPGETEAFDHLRFEKEVTNAKDLPNFHEVHPFLYRSGEPSEKGLSELKSKGITTIIDLRAESEKEKQERAQAHKLGIKYIDLPMSSEPPTKKQVDTFIKTVEDAQNQPQKGAVLVHCAHGSDRTGCLVGIWRVTHDHWNYEDAYKEMRHYWFTPKFTKLSGTVREYAQHASTGSNQ